MDGDSRIGRLAGSARWFVFAIAANDKRRARYWNTIARLRKRDIAERRARAANLTAPAVVIPPEVGFARADSALLPDTGDVVTEVRRMRSELTPVQRGERKPYLVDHPLMGLDLSSPLMRFALDRRVVDPAAAYLGMIPKLTAVTILASPHVPGAPTGSQLFHSDWEDVRQVKVFVNCSDVDTEMGPLTAVAADPSRRIKQALGYHYGGRHFRIPDERIEPLLTPGDTTAFTGPTGSVTFIDTSSCLHLGSRVQSGAGERLVVQFQFLTPAAFDLIPERRERRPFDSGHPTTDPVERLVLD